jgi:parvulin-like peptidyl-prolyl isomerase
MNKTDSFDSGAGATSAQEPENQTSSLDGVNANADFWAAWEEKREERRQQYLAEHGGLQQPAAAPPARGQRHFGLWKRPGGSAADAPAPLAQPGPIAEDAPIDNVSRVDETEENQAELAEFWVQWAAKAATTTPEGEHHRSVKGTVQKPVEAEAPAPTPPPASTRVKAQGFSRRAAQEARLQRAQEEEQEAHAAQSTAAEASKSAPTHVKAKGFSRRAAQEARLLRQQAEAERAAAAESAPDAVSEPAELLEAPDPGKKRGRATPVTIRTENGETVIEGGAVHQGYWTDWASKRRVEHSVEKKKTRESLTTARRKFWLLGIVIFAVGLGVGGGAVAYHLRADRLAIAVNGKPISQTEYIRRLEIDGGAASLKRIITQEEMLQFAAKHGLLPTQAQIHARILELKRHPDFQSYLTQSRQTLVDLERTVSYQLATEALTTQGVQASDAEMSSFYRANIDQSNPRSLYYAPDTATVRVIIGMSKPALEKAIGELHMGVSFETVAKHYSKDVSAQNGGLLPPIAKGRTKLTTLPGIEHAIFRLKQGSNSPPVPFLTGWAIFHCETLTPAHTKPYDEVKDDCRRQVLMKKGLAGNSARLSSEFVEFQKKSNVINMRQP